MIFPTRTIIQQAVHYGEAVATHVKTGAKTRSDEEVANLLATCQACESYDARHERCTLCGCKCNKSASAFLNKLRMATQHCPRQKW